MSEGEGGFLEAALAICSQRLIRDATFEPGRYHYGQRNWLHNSALCQGTTLVVRKSVAKQRALALRTIMQSLLETPMVKEAYRQ